MVPVWAINCMITLLEGRKYHRQEVSRDPDLPQTPFQDSLRAFLSAAPMGSREAHLPPSNPRHHLTISVNVLGIATARTTDRKSFPRPHLTPACQSPHFLQHE